MENKKLINILKKDMSELEELIGEMIFKQHFDTLEMEFVHTRAKGVLQLLQLLSAGDEPVFPEYGEGNAIYEKLKGKVEKVSKLTTQIKPEEIEEEVQQQKPVEQSLPGVVPEPLKKEEKESEEPETLKPPIPVQKLNNDEDMLQEENLKPEAGSRLGDSFLKGKSVNDLINEQVKLGFKLSNRPVSSIQSAIGINDRFQYIRELFEGDGKKFLEAVKTLDSMDNIKDAVDYLRTNYKWKKNETSLKFVNLVKRRFFDSTTG